MGIYSLNEHMITINLDKAKNIQKDRWRNARKPLLEKLDVEFLKAIETNNTAKQQEIISKKQQLRDVTNTDLSNISTPDQLKNVWPSILNS
jgi:hypothetical protein